MRSVFNDKKFVIIEFMTSDAKVAPKTGEEVVKNLR